MSNINSSWAILLAAGVGSRLDPLTRAWPKCLMPVHGRPLLEYWLLNLKQSKFGQVIVNTHHHAEQVNAFLERTCFSEWVHQAPEPHLLGTASTLREHSENIGSSGVLVAHADNWCNADLIEFRIFHEHHRPPGTVITMMTFVTNAPSNCGIVTLDGNGIVTGFFEKVENPPGDIANGAVYLIEPEVMAWIRAHPWATDLSTDVLPEFLGRIATWQNHGIHRDIGVLDALLEAQQDPPMLEENYPVDEWAKTFRAHPIHSKIKQFSNQQ